MMPHQNGHMPRALVEAMAAAQQPQPMPQQGGKPVDVSNGLLAPVDVRMSLRRQDIEDTAQTIPATAVAVPAEAIHPVEGQVKVVIFTVRTPCQTFTAMWDRETTRANIDWIRSFLSEEMPIIILPPSVAAPPDLRRMIMALAYEGTNGACGEIEVELDSTHAAEWADYLERALLALSGLTLPGQS